MSNAYMSNYDLAILGGGPAGYTAAIRASQLGLKVALVEEAFLGGTCLNHGCIPTKTLLEVAEKAHAVVTARDFGIEAHLEAVNYEQVTARKDAVVRQLRNGVGALLKRAKVEVLTGQGLITSPRTIQVQGREISAQYLLVATGAGPAKLPIPGIDLPGVIDSKEALALTAIPPAMVIIGGGVIGVELASIFSGLGSKVCVLEKERRLLPNEDPEAARLLLQSLKKQGIEAYTSAAVWEIQPQGGQLKVITVIGDKEHTFAADKVLVAVGRKPNTSGIGLEEIGVESTPRGITVNDQLQTNVPNVYAAGDVAGNYQLAHVAMAESIVAVHNMAGQPKRIRYTSVPRCVYTSPELAFIGLREEEARTAGYEVKVGHFPLRANGRALASGTTEGFIKVIAEATMGQVLGATIVGPNATELAPIIGIGIDLELTLEDLGASIPPHPTIAEAIREAGLDALGLPIHK